MTVPGSEPPIEDTLDELIPEWKALTIKMKAEGKTDEDVVAELRRRMNVQMDSLLDTYNNLKGT